MSASVYPEIKPKWPREMEGLRGLPKVLREQVDELALKYSLGIRAARNFVW